MTDLTRRHMISLSAAGALVPATGWAAPPREIGWEDLIPPGVPYSEIVGEGQMDVEADTWLPVFDANGTKLNEALNGAYIRLPGYIIPIEMSTTGVTQFILVPYVGACIHVPPPPPNQLVMVNAKTPWPNDQLWDAVWVIGTLQTQLQTNDIAETGYVLTADKMEIYEWL